MHLDLRTLAVDEQELLRGVLDTAAEGVFVVDAERKFVLVNRAADRMLDFATYATAEKWFAHYDVCTPDGRPFPHEQFPMLRALRGESTSDLLVLVRSRDSDEEIFISACGRPLDDANGTRIGAVLTFRDVTADVRARRELTMRSEQVEHVQKLREALTSYLVHDLKSPLAVIHAATEYLRDSRNLTSEEAAAAEDALLSSETLRGMISDLLDVHLAESGDFPLTISAVNVRSLASEIRSATERRARAHHVTVSLKLATSDSMIWADEKLVRRVLLNLLDNSFKYAPDGGEVCIEVSEADGSTVRMAVEDEGPGVPHEAREQIFEPFAKVQREPDARHRDSRGLGLRFCKLAVEAHGGRIWVEERSPHGNRFCIELPRRASGTVRKQHLGEGALTSTAHGRKSNVAR